MNETKTKDLNYEVDGIRKKNYKFRGNSEETLNFVLVQIFFEIKYDRMRHYEWSHMLLLIQWK